MDLRFQSSKWAGSIYQRFEALCQEVDDIVNQGTGEYVENHRQTGGNVKKNCIDTLQDLLPSSMVENGKDESQTSNVEPRIGMTEKCAIVDSSENRNEQIPLRKSGTSLTQHDNVLNLENTDTQTAQMDSLSLSMQRKNNEERYLKKQGDCLNPDNSIKENAIEKESFDSKILTCLAEAEGFSKAYSLPKSNERNHVNEIPGAFCASLAGNEGIARTENGGTASSTFTDEFHGVSNEAFIPTLTNEVACDQVKIDCVSENRLLQYFHADKQTDKGLSDGLPSSLSIIPAELSTEKLELSHKGESDKCGAESMMENIDLSDEVKLDESRVIVDSTLLSTATSFWPNSRRSYKKLLKDAFTSRRRLRKEYEQLTIMYGDFDTVSAYLKKMSSDDDNEWELL